MRRSFAVTPPISEVTMGFNAFDKNRLAALNAEQAEQAAPGGLAPAGPRNDYYIPQWEERTSYGVRRVDPYTKLFEDRIIFLGTPVTDDIANAVMAQLLCLQSMDADRQISMYINSPGGSFTAMTAIYDTMNYVRPDIQTICLGMAASAAAVLLAAGAKGQRLSLPNSTVLIHQPAMGQATYGQATDIEILGRRDSAHPQAHGEHARYCDWSERRANFQGHRSRQVSNCPGGEGVRPYRRHFNLAVRFHTVVW